ncbi:MAG: 2-iminoacetate synthase ThiH [Cyclobacteriaceae bacterium]|nr:2-iminoacetate synthase ThiH [Cyclobacteriaceae bacterium]MCH8517027.1 2-iminoacetate synthase ThiH [Cyclobacteriaceae bacterium]
MGSFREIFDQYKYEEIQERILSVSASDVKLSLNKSKRSVWDFLNLISPAALPFLEEMAHKSRATTLRRFGNNMQLFAPLYLSNECQNICTYCGFSLDVDIPRKTLNPKEILAEVEVLKKHGFDHILLVTGEANKTVGVKYFEKAIRLLSDHFAHISLEVQPLDTEEYQQLIEAGLNTVLVYQETYHKENYKLHHPKGKKSNFYYRLDTPDRLGKAGIHKMGLGALIGLEDWRVDSFFTAMHLEYLERTYWRTKYSLSFPRLRPNAGGQEPKLAMSDRELVQLICAYRLFNEDVELSLSTRESELFRDHAFKLGITSMSAGSKTNPGGYAQGEASLEQFEISDERSVGEICEILTQNQYVPLWKDWDTALQTKKLFNTSQAEN